MSLTWRDYVDLVNCLASIGAEVLERVIKCGSTVKTDVDFWKEIS